MMRYIKYISNNPYKANDTSEKRNPYCPWKDIILWRKERAIPCLLALILHHHLHQQSISDLVSSLGGAFSLYMGISVFLLLEVFEFIVYLFVNSCLYVTGRYFPKKEVKTVVPKSPTLSDVLFVQRLIESYDTKVSAKSFQCVKC